MLILGMVQAGKRYEMPKWRIRGTQKRDINSLFDDRTFRHAGTVASRWCGWKMTKKRKEIHEKDLPYTSHHHYFTHIVP